MPRDYVGPLRRSLHATHGRSHHARPRRDPNEFPLQAAGPCPHTMADIIAGLPVRPIRSPLHVCRCSLCGRQIFAAQVICLNDKTPHKWPHCCEHCGLSLNFWLAEQPQGTFAWQDTPPKDRPPTAP